MPDLTPTEPLAAINAACAIIETADARNLANDGPAGGCPPQMSLSEWRLLYVTLDTARAGQGELEMLRAQVNAYRRGWDHDEERDVWFDRLTGEVMCLGENVAAASEPSHAV